MGKQMREHVVLMTTVHQIFEENQLDDDLEENQLEENQLEENQLEENQLEDMELSDFNALNPNEFVLIQFATKKTAVMYLGPVQHRIDDTDVHRAGPTPHRRY